MSEVNKYAPLFAASRAGMPWRRDGETAPTVIVGTERITPGTLTVTVLSGPTIRVDGGKAYTMDEGRQHHPLVAGRGTMSELITFKTCQVLELKIVPMALADRQVLRYTMVVELTAEQYDKIAQGLKPNEPQ